MKNIIFTLFVLSLCTCNTNHKTTLATKSIRLNTFDLQKKSGLGVLTPCLNDTTIITFYESFNSEEPFDSLFFTSRYTDNGYQTQFKTFYISERMLKPLKLSEGSPMPQIIAYGPDIAFRVVAIEGRDYEVIIDEFNGETVVIKIPESYTIYDKKSYEYDEEYDPNNPPNNNCYSYETWEEYVLRAELVTQNHLVLYDAPNGKVVYSQIDDGTFSNSMHVLKIEGEWAQIEFRDRNDYAKTWIKWIDKDCLQINIIEATYD